MKKFFSANKHKVIIFVVMLISALFITSIFAWLYFISRENIINLWSNSTVQVAADIGTFLESPESAVSFTALKLDEMIANGASKEEILEYVSDESDIYSTIIEGSYSGIYAYYDGELIDPDGWAYTGDGEYDIGERPWYAEAKKANGRTVFVLPYTNLRTHTTMISVSRLLSDKESVISMDIFLVTLQDKMKKLVTENEASAALLIDKGGTVIAHSDRTQVGLNYLEGDDPFKSELAKVATTSHDKNFRIQDEENSYIAFFSPCPNGWTVVLLSDESKLFKSMGVVYVVAAVMLFFILSAAFGISVFLSRRDRQVEHLGKEISAIADIYASMILLDLDADKITVLKASSFMLETLNDSLTDMSKRINTLSEVISSEQWIDLNARFFNIYTLNERLKDATLLSQEFVNSLNNWMRARIIPVERKADGSVKSVLLAFESIDEERKKQEHLRHLSETDKMTGILNRGTGEQKIREKLADGEPGMFCLFDADKFKSINDNFGHAVGDKVIMEIAKCLTKTFRDSDVYFRLGGDEFAAYCAEVNNPEIGQRIFDRFFNCIDNIYIPELGHRRIYVSAGAAFFKPDEDTFETLYKRADEATYKSKKIEGNAVTFTDS